MRSPTLAIVGLVFTAVVAVIVFGCAGRIDLPFVWGCLAIQICFWIVAASILSKDLLSERAKPGAEGRVHDFHRALAVPLIVASWVIVGLDLGRFHWSDTIPTWLRVVGLAGYAVGMAIVLWAMVTNRFYSSIIRLQTDRGHHPITTGPYRMVRHPGYAGTILACIAGGLALGSWLGMLPMLAIALLFIRRVVNEDGMLRARLEGYESYAQRVRWRLVRGVW